MKRRRNLQQLCSRAMRLLVLVAVFAASFGTLATARADNLYPGATWATASPAEAGMDGALLGQARGVLAPHVVHARSSLGLLVVSIA